MDDLFANNEEQEDVLFGNLEYNDQNISSDDHSMFTEVNSDYNRIRKKMIFLNFMMKTLKQICKLWRKNY